MNERVEKIFKEIGIKLGKMAAINAEDFNSELANQLISQSDADEDHHFIFDICYLANFLKVQVNNELLLRKFKELMLKLYNTKEYDKAIKLYNSYMCWIGNRYGKDIRYNQFAQLEPDVECYTIVSNIYTKYIEQYQNKTARNSLPTTQVNECIEIADIAQSKDIFLNAMKMILLKIKRDSSCAITYRETLVKNSYEKAKKLYRRAKQYMRDINDIFDTIKKIALKNSTTQGLLASKHIDEEPKTRQPQHVRSRQSKATSNPKKALNSVVLPTLKSPKTPLRPRSKLLVSQKKTIGKKFREEQITSQVNPKSPTDDDWQTLDEIHDGVCKRMVSDGGNRLGFTSTESGIEAIRMAPSLELLHPGHSFFQEMLDAFHEWLKDPKNKKDYDRENGPLMSIYNEEKWRRRDLEREEKDEEEKTSTSNMSMN